MTVTDQMKQSVEAFFSRLADVPDNYRNSVFSYVAVKVRDKLMPIPRAGFSGASERLNVI